MKKFNLIFALFTLVVSPYFLYSQDISNSFNWMPVPREYKTGQGRFRLTKDFTVNVQSGAHKRLYSATDRFLRRLDGRTGMFFVQ
ncbi:MAG: hypothetical protein K2Q22_14960, partial [Cytophagales bacterium]|nr:hypothetical protein [Cytophagales bacterium]